MNGAESASPSPISAPFRNDQDCLIGVDRKVGAVGTIPAVEFINIEKRFGGSDAPAVTDISFTVDDGSFVSIVGPSGCGKSTLLNMTAGLMTPDVGEVRFQGAAVEHVNTRVGYITQNPSLLPWMTVRDNIGLSLEIRKVPRSERQKRVDYWIDAVGLTGFESHYPAQLSGGMQKRCSIARTLIYEPDVVLMDEPFGPLDALTRLTLQRELLDIWEANRRTFIFVTHDLHEAVALSSKVVVMTRHPGRVRVIMPVDIPRPRDMDHIGEDPEFGRLTSELWGYLRNELD